mmetsp:Transcript_2097/g.6398  ORF Transcript_2097/g.6398 Transcript_2097/m.6398 type:complete len:310 (+) Transcript_2097:188-1117(+)
MDVGSVKTPRDTHRARCDLFPYLKEMIRKIQNPNVTRGVSTRAKKRERERDGVRKRGRRQAETERHRRDRKTQEEEEEEKGWKKKKTTTKTKSREGPKDETVAKLGRMCKAAGITKATHVFMKHKTNDERQKALEELLGERGLDIRSSAKDLARVKENIEREKDLEDIDASNIIEGGRRSRNRTHVSYKGLDVSESEEEEEEESDDVEIESDSERKKKKKKKVLLLPKSTPNTLHDTTSSTLFSLRYALCTYFERFCVIPSSVLSASRDFSRSITTKSRRRRCLNRREASQSSTSRQQNRIFSRKKKKI